VLLAEDNATSQKVGAKILSWFGCLVDVAKNGKEALKALENKDYDLVFMDCHMPIMDGYEATAFIRKGKNPEIPIVAMTANAMAGDRDACLAAGMDDYIAKPVTRKAVEKVLEKYLEKDVNLKNAGLQVLNLERLTTILGNDLAEIKELLDIFIEEMATLFSELEKGPGKNEPETIERLAHRIKGAAGDVGGELMHEAAVALEIAAREHKSENTCQEYFLKLKKEYGTISKTISRIFE